MGFFFFVCKYYWEKECSGSGSGIFLIWIFIEYVYRTDQYAWECIMKTSVAEYWLVVF